MIIVRIKLLFITKKPKFLERHTIFEICEIKITRKCGL